MNKQSTNIDIRVITLTINSNWKIVIKLVNWDQLVDSTLNINESILFAMFTDVLCIFTISAI